MSVLRSARSRVPALAVTTSVLVVLGSVVSAPAHAADDTTVDGVTYALVDTADPAQGASATEYVAADNPTHPDLVIEESVTIDGEVVPVVEVGHNAFRESDLESVVLPDSVTELGPYAFGDNPDLASVDLGDEVESIGTGAFRGGALTQIDLPDSIINMNPQAFYDNQLPDVVIPPGVTVLELDVFRQNQLTHVEIPAQVTGIRERAVPRS